MMEVLLFGEQRKITTRPKNQPRRVTAGRTRKTHLQMKAGCTLNAVVQPSWSSTLWTTSSESSRGCRLGIRMLGRNVRKSVVEGQGVQGPAFDRL